MNQRHSSSSGIPGSVQAFPKDFLWGASTASHQVEGNTHNQWTEWELANASRLAKTAKQRLDWMPRWEAIKDQAQDPANYVSGNGVAHYKLYKHDFELLKQLQLNAFRFGIEWARVEPTEGEWDQAAFDHYKTYIQTQLSMGIVPVLNLWHWTMPVWFTNKGGFEHRANLKYFERFVQKVCQELPIKQLKLVLTLNEPNVYASFSYFTAEWPPNQKSFLAFVRVYYNLTLAHKRAYKILKQAHPHIQVGIAQQLANVQAKRPHSVLDQLATKWMRYFWNWWFYNRINKYQDFVGFNYYFTDYYRLGDYRGVMHGDLFHRANPKMPKNDLGWYMEPEGIYPLLVRVWAHYKKPIYITENGVADGDDAYRQWWLQETMVAMERAISEGIDLKGYFHWSLLDNFEWAYGWWPQFGLIGVDRQNGMKRSIKPSAKWWAKWLANNH